MHETEPQPEPEPEPKAVLPASAAGDQGLAAVVQYDYEVRVMPSYVGHSLSSLMSFDRPQKTTSFPWSRARLSWVSYKRMWIGGLAVVQTAPGVVCSPRRTSPSSKRSRNPNPNSRPKKKRRRRHHHHRHRRLQLRPLQPYLQCPSPSLSLLPRASLQWHYMSVQDALPCRVLSDLCQI